MQVHGMHGSSHDGSRTYEVGNHAQLRGYCGIIRYVSAWLHARCACCASVNSVSDSL